MDHSWDNLISPGKFKGLSRPSSFSRSVFFSKKLKQAIKVNTSLGAEKFIQIPNAGDSTQVPCDAREDNNFWMDNSTFMGARYSCLDLRPNYRTSLGTIPARVAPRPGRDAEWIALQIVRAAERNFSGMSFTKFCESLPPARGRRVPWKKQKKKQNRKFASQRMCLLVARNYTRSMSLSRVITGRCRIPERFDNQIIAEWNCASLSPPPPPPPPRWLAARFRRS